MKKVQSIIALSFGAVILSAPASHARDMTYDCIFAGFFGPAHPNTAMMEYFKESLEQISGGRFRVELKPDHEAGGEEKILESVKRGTIQIAQAGGLLQIDEPMLAGWEQPFMINSWEHARRVFLSDGIKSFEGDYAQNSGARIVGIIVNGFRQISSSYPVTSMRDFARMKIRTPLNQAFIELFAAFGANPIPLPANELYDALKIHKVDGQDNPYPMICSHDWQEVNEYMLETRHIFSPTFVIVNEKWYQGLDDEARARFDEAMSAAVAYNWTLSEQHEQECIDFMKDHGITFNIPSDAFREQMVKAASVVYDFFDANYPGSQEVRAYCASVDPENDAP